VSDNRSLRDALWSLSVGYARTVDRQDAEGFLALFTPDAVLTMHNPPEAEPGTVYRGHEDLARIPARMARFTATYHFLGQADFDLAGDGAPDRATDQDSGQHRPAGQVHCVAHHRSEGPEGATDYVMFIRYRDRYRQDGGTWRIAERRVLVDWTETRPANPPGR
jgi:hypothetical protein